MDRRVSVGSARPAERPEDALVASFFQKHPKFDLNSIRDLLAQGYAARKEWVIRLVKLLKVVQDAELLDHLCALVCVLARFSISVKELKEIFSFLYNSAGSRPHFWLPLVKVFQDLLEKKPDNLRSMFAFSGHSSGIMIPTLPLGTWPISGYSILTWIRVDSFEDALPHYYPRLFSFLSDGGLGIEAWFNKNQLVVEVTNAGKKARVSFKFSFQRRTWYFLTLSHTYNMIFSSEMFLYVNGQLIEKQSLIYPVVKAPMTRSHLASNGESFVTATSRPQSLAGQMGFFMVLERSLLPPDMHKLMLQLGPNLESFCNLDTSVRTGQWGRRFLIDNDPCRVVFCYNPRATDRILCYDTASNKMSLCATRMEGVAVYSTVDLRTALFCSGGVPFFMPLFLYGGDRAFNPVPPLVCLTRLLEEPVCQAQMLQMQGFGILGYLLQLQSQVSRGWGVEVVQHLVGIGKLLVKDNVPLFVQLLKHVLTDWRIWVNTDYPVQQTVVGYLARYVKDRKKVVKKHLGICSFVDLHREFFCEMRARGAQLSPQQFKDLSFRVLDLIAELSRKDLVVLSKKGYDPATKQALLAYMRETGDAESLHYQPDLYEELQKRFLVITGPVPEQVQGDELRPELERRRRAVLEQQKQQTQNEKAWRGLRRGLLLALQQQPESLYRLDRTENSSRMRRRLQPDPDGSRHEGCAKRAEQTPTKPKQDLTRLASVAVHLVQPETEPEDDIEEEEVEEKAAKVEENFLFKENCTQVTPLHLTTGVFQLTPTYLYFFAEETQVQGGSKSDAATRLTDSQWEVARLAWVHRCRYQMQYRGIEIAFTTRQTFLFAFESEAEAIRVFEMLWALRPPSFDSSQSWKGVPAKNYGKIKKVTDRWRNRQMSNFDYLMFLNTMASRSYNDITQYPIFPHVLADYTSEKLDLENPVVFRDLSKPIGALNPERLRGFLERYEEMPEPKFLYGSLYSSVGTTLWYLLRLEPFTTLSLLLQGGSFDHAERMFHSTRTMWEGVLQNPSDVKELIPEFFYLPEMFTNINQVEFGRRGDQSIGEVELPPWAQGSPERFVAKQREALESDYVSEHLHEWIDLIFGSKQVGEEAVKAHNVFFYLTYEGLDLDKIQDPEERAAVESQLFNFGMVPPRLFHKPHIKRKSQAEIDRPNLKKAIVSTFAALLRTTVSAPQSLGDIEIQEAQTHKTTGIPAMPVCFVASAGSSIVMVYRDGVYSLNPISPQGERTVIELDSTLGTFREKRFPLNLSSQRITSFANCFAISDDGKCLLSCGNVDNSILFSNPSTGMATLTLIEHKDVVTAIALDHGWIATGSDDTTVLIWDATAFLAGKTQIRPVLIARISNHNYGISAVELNFDCDLVVSADKDRTCAVHSLRAGEFVRWLPHQDVVRLIQITGGGLILTSDAGNRLSLWTINGKLLLASQLNETLSDMRVTAAGNYLVTGGTGSAIRIWSLPELNNVHTFDIGVPIDSISLEFEDAFIFAGLSNGHLKVFPLNDHYWKNEISEDQFELV